MAKKKKQQPKSPVPKVKGPEKKQKADKEHPRGPAFRNVESNLKRGQALASEYLPKWDDLIQYDQFKPESYEAMLGNLSGFAGMDPNNPNAYAGKISGETQSIIDKYKGNVDYSSDTQDIISRMRGGLEGYAAPELNAMREVQARQNQRNLQTTMRDLTNQGARSGLSGAAGSLQRLSAQNAANRSAQDLEQELFVKNADEKQRRLNDFGGYMTVQEKAKADRLAQYGEFATGAEGDAFERGRAARSDYTSFLDNMRNAEVERTTNNIGQQDKSKAMESAANLGMTGLLTQGQNQNWLKKFMEEHPYSSAPDGFAGGGGGYEAGGFESFMNMIKEMMSGGKGESGSSGATPVGLDSPNSGKPNGGVVFR